MFTKINYFSIFNWMKIHKKNIRTKKDNKHYFSSYLTNYPNKNNDWTIIIPTINIHKFDK